MTNEDIKSRLAEWLADGEVGLSSKSIAMAAMRMPEQRISYPHDPSDLRRCLLLIRQVPEVRTMAFPELAAASPEWDELIKVWDSLEQKLVEETSGCLPNHGNAPETYRMMNEAEARGWEKRTGGA